MATIEVQPRETPAESNQPEVEVEVDEDLTVLADSIEQWAAPRQAWEATFREGHEFGRANNVEVEVLFAAGEQTSGLHFRLDQLDTATDTGSERLSLAEQVEAFERALIERCLSETGGKINAVLERLKIPRRICQVAEPVAAVAFHAKSPSRRSVPNSPSV